MRGEMEGVKGVADVGDRGMLSGSHLDRPVEASLVLVGNGTGERFDFQIRLMGSAP